MRTSSVSPSEWEGSHERQSGNHSARDGLVLGTRAALGIGLGLVLANRLTEEQPRTVGRTLLLAGGFVAAALGSPLFGRPRPFTLALGEPDHQPEVELARETVMSGD